jgi:glycosyltransferase involved in cell wall biosynthesis
VEFAGFVPDEQASRYYAAARAVYFAPVDEDYGYGAVEALQAARPVVTTTDSGGVLEFVEHEVTGLVTPPDPAAVARSLAALMADPDKAARLGAAGRERVKGITWDGVVDTLLSSVEF